MDKSPNPTLIYCGGGNPTFQQIAIEAGFLLGARLPDTIYGPLYFADQHWKRPNRARYMQALTTHTPHMATVLDLEHEDQLPEVLDWADEAAALVDIVIIIPKVSGIIPLLPRSISDTQIRLGFSVPTRYAGTSVPLWEFLGWPVHLLGGSPHKQALHARYLNVLSADGNMAASMAIRYCRVYQPDSRLRHQYGLWVPLRIIVGHKNTPNAHHEAFKRSCRNIQDYWRTQ